MPMMKEKQLMKILQIENGIGLFWSVSKKHYSPIDKIDKSELLDLLDFFLENECEMDELSEGNLHNQAHAIIYPSIYQKFLALKNNKAKFKDESQRLYINEIRKYTM